MNTKIFKEMKNFVTWTIDHENIFLSAFFIMIYFLFWLSAILFVVTLFMMYPLISAVVIVTLIGFVIIPMYKADMTKAKKKG